MTQVCVQFLSASEETILAAFCVAQDAEAYPYQGTVDTSDPRWKAFYDAQSAFAKQGWPAPD